MIYTELTQKALKISFAAHKDQVDKGGMPYVYHPFHLAEQMKDEYTTCVALLHDVVEDTHITVEYLKEQGFPSEVTDAVSLLTHDENEPYFKYISDIKSNPIAKAVKLADLKHNSDRSRLDYIDAKVIERLNKYQKAIAILESKNKMNTDAIETLDRIKGSLIGGAAGDALGYAIEFCDEKAIFSKYGENGIQQYSLDPMSKKALISDDTQMTLFTASALIFHRVRGNGKGLAPDPRFCADMTYQDWLVTQEMTYEEAVRTIIKDYPDYPDGFISCMFKNVPELFHRRAPGTTCLSALHTRKKQREAQEYVQRFTESKINNSKGCGGVMRVAPVGIMDWCTDYERMVLEGAECAAITHSHSLGYMPAAVLVMMIHQIIYNDLDLSLKDIIIAARNTAAKLFAGDEHLKELIDCINNAIELSENSDTDLDNIHRLGEGWVAEEALAIAIYCSLKYHNDFSKGIIAAVNHRGDSDSTGAITGNILGAWVGYEAIEQKWKDDLEMFDVILQTADFIQSHIYFDIQRWQ